MIFSRRIKRHDLNRIMPAPSIFAGRAQEKAIRLTMEFLQKNIAEAKQRSTPILGLDLNSELELKEVNEQVEEPYVGNSTAVSRKWQDMKWKTC